ncbi:ATP-binding protein [Tychonema sp. LEGE 07203]|uniref:ATP-binding protein n=1 Tax=Tychonema sp. LEGE 07203 TaxID=1828671 RepID=UPI0018827AB4|nr:ATP-binding protein [Tychonema sp. LEGE 07203]MBE9093727.1 sensor histidine kinase [Tychonema sp. LEGE 07203]
MEPTDWENKIKNLENANLILRQKLERSEAERSQLEVQNQEKTFLLKTVCQEFIESEKKLKARMSKLEKALENQKAMQIKLIEAEKMSALGILVAGIAHEINNPVNFIYGNITYVNDYTGDILKLLEMYQNRYPETDAEIEDFIEKIDLNFLREDLLKTLSSMKVGSERIREIVLTLRNFARVDEAEKKPVNIHEGIDSTLVILQNSIKEKPGLRAIKIVKNYGDLPKIECYPGQLNQVFMNIINNAVDALREQEKQSSTDELEANPSLIEITTSVISNNWARVSIKDNGLGMNESVKAKIFDPFFTTKPVGHGTGLGLSISYQIVVDKHGGRLECISAVGEGTEFAIEIPIVAKSSS